MGSDGAVWLSAGGLVKFHNDNWTVFNPDNSDLPDLGISDLATATNGAIWVSTLFY